MMEELVVGKKIKQKRSFRFRLGGVRGDQGRTQEREG